MANLPDQPDPADSYDPTDPQADCFRPPAIPTLVWCLHCGQEYDSWKMHYEITTDPDGSRHGIWRCGTPGCDGAGFGFDIFPCDEHYIDPDGRDVAWQYDDDDQPPEPHEDDDRPPDQPTPVRCERCGQHYSSADMVWWVEQHDDPHAWRDFGWRCPTPDCNGMGFGLDIRPTDPNYIDQLGRRILGPGEKPSPPDPPSANDDIPF